MTIVEILLITIFGLLLVLVTLEKVEKLIGGVLGSLLVFFILFIDEQGQFVLTELLEFVDFEIVITILGLLVAVEATRRSGFFQWLGVLGIKATKGRAYPLFILLCLTSGFLAGFVTSIAVMIVIGGLTVDITRILDINALPYLTAEAITVNVGVLLSPIASVPNIIIFNEFQLTSFAFYAINLAPFCLFLLPFSIIVLFNRIDILEEPTASRRRILLEFSEWTVVGDRRLFKEAAALFIAMIISFIVIPNLFPQIEIWMISAVFMFIFIALPESEAENIIQNIDWETIFFLIGLFIMVKALSYKGLLTRVANSMEQLLGGNELLSILVVFWIACLASGVIDNIAVTLALIPIIRSLIAPASPLHHINKVLLSTLIIGVNLGGNLTPMASPTTVLAMSLSKKTGEELTPTKFFKIGFISTLIQIVTSTIYLLLVFFLKLSGISIGIINLFTLMVGGLVYMLLYFREDFQTKIINLFTRIKSGII